MQTPAFLYGTAWKEERTAELVGLALAAGFRAIDTANQRKHYNEAGVGEALARTNIPREQLFLQSKFTYQRGQDHRLPYDPSAPLPLQVEQSFASSLAHLNSSYLDSYILHGPSGERDWSEDDRSVWASMETLHAAGRVRALGVSNVTLHQLQGLVASASVQPSFVQKRCYAREGWDREMRAYCATRDISYQAFSLLTANRQELSSRTITELAARYHTSVPQLVFKFAQQIGMLPLTGTSSAEHMAQDLHLLDENLSKAELRLIESIAG